MNCVMGHIQIERSFFFYGFGDLPIRFYSQRFTQEGICTVIFLQVRNCSNLLSLDMPVSPFAIIAAGMSNAGTCDIYIKADIQRILSFASHTAEMCFSYMNGFISGLLQDSRHGRHIFSETFPVPLGRSERIPIVALSINPVSDSMPGRILSGHDGTQEHIFRLTGEGVATERLNLTTTLLILILKLIYRDKIMGEGLNATVTTLEEMREYGKNTNLITRKLTDAEWRDALYVMRVHQMIDVPGAVKDVEDTTPIYIYSTINLYCASLDIDKIVEKYREELKEEDLEAGEEDHYEDADQ